MRKFLKGKLCALLCAFLALAVPLGACTKSTGNDSSSGTSSESSISGESSSTGSSSDSSTANTTSDLQSNTETTDTQSTDTTSTDTTSTDTTSTDTTSTDTTSTNTTSTDTTSTDTTSTDTTSTDSTGTDDTSGDAQEQEGDDDSGSTEGGDTESGDQCGGSTQDGENEDGQTDQSGDTDTIITSSGGYEESLYITWETSNPSNDRISYKLASADTYTTFTDENLVSTLSATKARADIVGLEAGEYDVQIISGGNYYNATVTVDGYDRSGYAHFNYTDGVGAYNDDGTLKDNAVVIYLTDSNKNDISDSCYVYSSSDNSYSKIDISDYFPDGSTCHSIGYLLNNSQYSSNGIAALTKTYGAVAVRVIDTVNAEVEGDGTASEIYGLTAWEDYTDVDGDGERSDGDEDGDNGRLARMVGAKNVTIEGIGEDATIRGWGFHFICNDTTGKTGYGFEVRNITFTRYSEDAIGMEGKSSGTTITAPVQRCWIHNNSFYVGYCEADSSVELDKGDGDGSCDFKRGEYFTFSYNYLEGCHKTNLIGANDTCPQYNISIHHNYYNTCKARLPLVRMANVHYYNNYVYGTTDTAISSRSNSYVYSEYNYYENNNKAIEIQTNSSGAYGAVKSYNDVFVSNTSNAATIAASRTASVTNTCYDNGKSIDYSSFDTSTTLFYYDDYELTADAATAKTEVIAGAGVHSASNSTSGTATGGTTGDTSGGTQTTGTSVEINISDLEIGTLDDDYELGTGVYVKGTSLKITASNKTHNGTKYTQRLQTGGYLGSAAIKIEATDACTITIYVISSDSKEDREVGLFSSTNTSDLIGSTETLEAGTDIVEMTFTISSAGTYYIGTLADGINIYYIAVTY